MADVLAVTPTLKELRALEQFLNAEEHQVLAFDSRVPALVVADLGLIAAAAGHGKAQFALVTQHLLDTHGPFEAVVAIGVAGALDSRLDPGDVVVGTEAVEHDYKPRFHGVSPPPRHAASSALVKSIVDSQPERTSFRIYEGPIAGGDEDVVDARRAEELALQTGAFCVAWEGAGGARAADFHGVPYVEVRGVTDRSDGSAPDSYRLNLADAMRHVGQVLLSSA